MTSWWTTEVIAQTRLRRAADVGRAFSMFSVCRGATVTQYLMLRHLFKASSVSVMVDERVGIVGLSYGYEGIAAAVLFCIETD